MTDTITQKSKSPILDFINSISIEKLTRFAYVLLTIWVLWPLGVIILNIIGVSYADVSTAWVNVVMYIGYIGLVVGGLYICIINKQSKTNLTKKKILDILPIVTLGFFLIWVLVCALTADSIWIGFVGYSYRHEGFLTYLAYAGFFTLGLLLSNNRKKVIKLAQSFVGTTVVLSLATIIRTPFTEKAFFSEIESQSYRAIYFNLNHFGYILLLATLTCFFLFMYDRTNKKKTICYLILSFFLVSEQILNDTLGSYLATFVCLIFVFVWSLINKEQTKLVSLSAIGLFLLATIASLLYTPNIYVNFKSVFGDIDILNKFFAGMIGEEEFNHVGTGRAVLWKYAIEKFKDKPIFGYGPDGLAIPYYADGLGIDRPHNIFIQTAAFFGIPGFILYFSTFVIGAKRLIKAKKQIEPFVKAAAFIVVGYMMSAFFGNSMFYTSPYFLIVFGVCCSGCLNNANAKKV